MKRGQMSWFFLFIAALITLVIIVLLIPKFSSRISGLLDYLRGIA